MTISLTIPSTRVPGSYIDFDSSRALSGLPAVPQRVLIIGQLLAGATIAALTATQMFSAGQGVAFGRGSICAQMVSAFKGANDQTECWAIGVADLLAGTFATQTLTFTGPATAAGTLPLMVAGTSVPVGVNAGDSATAVATATAAALNGLPDLPVAASSAAGVVTLTARHKGLCGNDIDVRLGYYPGDAIPAGLTGAIAVGTVATGNPDITPVWAAIGDKQFDTIIMPWTDSANLTALNSELVRRWGPMVEKEGMAYASIRAGMSAAATLGASLNSAYLSILPVRNGPTPPWQVAAIYGAVIAYYGAIDPARPFQSLPLTGMMAPAQVDRFIRTERDLLLHDGMSSFKVADDGTCTIERPISTYQTNGFGVPDIAWLDVNTPLTLAYIRAAVRARIALKFPRMKLADDGTIFGAGQAIVTPRIIRAELIALFGELESAGLVENIAQFKADLVVERDATDPNRVNSLIPPNIVNQFRVFAASIQFRL